MNKIIGVTMTNGDIGLIFSALCLIVPIILLLIWRGK